MLRLIKYVRARFPWIMALAALTYVPMADAADWLINEDYKQLDARGATDFEILFEGAVGDRITGGGLSHVTNPFANGTRTVMPQAGFPSNTVVRFAGSDAIPRDINADRHFGIYGIGFKPVVLAKAWSYPTIPTRVPVPKSNVSFGYDSANQSLRIMVKNTSVDTVTFQDVGYLISATERPLEDLSRDVLPPSAFNGLLSLNHEYAPGEWDSVLIEDVPHASFAITYATVFFSGASASNDYTLTGGEWAAVAVASQPVPEPSSAWLLLAGLLAVGALHRRQSSAGMGRLRYLALLARRYGPFLLVMFTSLTFWGQARADVFVVPLASPPTAGDPRPFIDLKITKGDGTTVTIKTLIDTGSASSELKVTEGIATAAGLDKTTGTASAERGINGVSPSTSGVTIPPALGLGPASPPIIPSGQPLTSPVLPTKATIGSLPPGREGTLGNGYLKANFDAAAQLDGYFYFVAKGQGAQGVARAVAISSFLAFSAPVALNVDGRPEGTRSALITPTTPKVLAPGEEASDGGFNLAVDVATASGTVLRGVPFVMHSGFSTTLISSELASSMGLDINTLPTRQIEGNFGLMSVHSADLQLRLFDDPSFPVFSVMVGVTDSASNPFGDNVLGADVLGLLPYTETYYNADNTATFYAASSLRVVPEPAAALIAVAGLAVLWLSGRARRPL